MNRSSRQACRVLTSNATSRVTPFQYISSMRSRRVDSEEPGIRFHFFDEGFLQSPSSLVEVFRHMATPGLRKRGKQQMIGINLAKNEVNMIVRAASSTPRFPLHVSQQTPPKERSTDIQAERCNNA